MKLKAPFMPSDQKTNWTYSTAPRARWTTYRSIQNEKVNIDLDSVNIIDSKITQSRKLQHFGDVNEVVYC